MHPLGPLTSSLLLALAFFTRTASACRVSLECPPTQDCIRGICQTPGCTSDIECDAGYLCYGGDCATGKYVGEGESCAGRDRCWSDLWCDRTLNDGTYKRYLDIGEHCETNTDRCEPGAVCNLAGVCAHYGLLGPSFAKPCYANSQGVDQGVRSSRVLRIWQRVGRMCGPPSVNHYGEACAQDGDCGIGLNCHWGLCLNPLITAQYAPNGFACRTNEDCCSKNCQTRVVTRNLKRGQVRVCGVKTDGSPPLPGC
ncbi:hypothetical protein QBC34DRAFT_439209 [Podospora aff. communis PSN243]|uniref:Uncharacterized protein n=1 Tax=Podospora aff. communis PSN243 TaxID=3040156 RepID=A0AAV9GP55_9PEZI|nr:hypothetical protein QBC34DRAFT_439209 [Podospora aff. communis PSN243]